MRKEILAGLSTFFTAAYLFLLYPKILSEGGIDFGSAFTATILISVFATVFSAIYSHFPVLLAPGLSVGPYLVYSVILKQNVPWQAALGIVFWTGLIIFVMSVFKLRQKILFNLPVSIKSAAIAGIGLFLISVGLKDLGVFEGNILTIPNAIALCGLLIFFVLYRFQFKGAFLFTILICWTLAIPFDLVSWNGFAALPSTMGPTFFQLDLWTPLKPEFIGTILTVVLICLFDTSASLAALAKLAHKIDEQGQIKKIDRIVIPDGLGSMMAAFLGTGTLTFTLESASGIKAGGRSYITALTAALCSLIGLFFYPLISSIPLFATIPILIAIGIFMTLEVKGIHWKDYTESLPALLTLIIIPATFSIYQGFAFGFVSFAFLKALKGQWKQVHPVCWVLALIFATHLAWTLLTNGK